MKKYNIKQLVWEEGEKSRDLFHKARPIASYFFNIEYRCCLRNGVWIISLDGQSINIYVYPKIDKAKQACQEHFETLMEQGLEEV